MTANLIQLEAKIPNTWSGMRFDHALVKLFPEYSRSKLQHWIRNSQALANDKLLSPSDKLRGGEIVIISATPEPKQLWEGQKIPLHIVYEDETLIIINKPTGLVVHPASGNLDQTLVNALIYHEPKLIYLPRAGIIHRLDKNTSGLLVVAKTLTAHSQLVKQLQERRIKREYQTIVVGQVIAGGKINAPIGRHPIHRQRMAVISNGKPAVTYYRVLTRFEHYTHLSVQLETGRTHQIRVHMAYINHGVVGDPSYNGRYKLPKNLSPDLISILNSWQRQALHAHTLGLQHPEKHEYCEWSTPLPNDMQQLLDALRSMDRTK